MNRRTFVGLFSALAAGFAALVDFTPVVEANDDAQGNWPVPDQASFVIHEYRLSDRSIVIALHGSWTLDHLQAAVDNFDQTHGFPIDLRMTHATRRKLLMLVNDIGYSVDVIQTPAGQRDRFVMGPYGPDMSIDDTMHGYAPDAIRLVYGPRRVSPFFTCEG